MKMTIPSVDACMQQAPLELTPGTIVDELCSAACEFVGRTRPEVHEQLGRLHALEYGAYEPMASRCLEDVAHEACNRWPLRSVWIRHAIGIVQIGQPSVIIRVGSIHRDDAFKACRYVIDRIKTYVPVWKNQLYEHGRLRPPGMQVQLQDTKA